MISSWDIKSSNFFGRYFSTLKEQNNNVILYTYSIIFETPL